MTILDQLNSAPIYLICGAIILFVMIMCAVFMLRAWKAGIAIGMDRAKLRKTVITSITFTLLPSISILLGVIALSGSLGVPLPWLRLSVIGALHYETQAADAAARPFGFKLGESGMTGEAFTTIALVMSAGIIVGMLLTVFLNKRYTSKLQKKPAKAEAETGKKKGKSLGDIAMVAMFIGLVSAYIGSYVGACVNSHMGLTAEKGTFSQTPFNNTTPLVALGVSALAMALMTWLVEKKNLRWMDSFALPLSMLIGMAAVVVANVLFGVPEAA